MNRLLLSAFLADVVCARLDMYGLHAVGWSRSDLWAPKATIATAATATATPPPSGLVFSTTPAALPPPGQPDISYHPDWSKYKARVARRTQTENLPNNLPKGFPERVKGDLVWEGENLAQKYEWAYVLSADQQKEIDNAATHFKSLKLGLDYIMQETFPLPNLHAKLHRLSHELHFGHVVFVLCGLDVVRYTREENVIIYTGVSSHISSIRGCQDAYLDGKRADAVIGHIKDVRSVLGEGKNKDQLKIGTPAYTADKQVFHTDSGDVVSLFTLSTAAEGGASRLASAWRIYNHLATSRPALIHTLSGDWEAELHLPPITEAQAEALDVLYFLGERFSVSTEFQKGDMQYVNNLAIFHARDGFTDEDGKR
ncbi:hypothetical protein DDE83_001578 [Stemphylium lycopersici]|uniref:TauD/TfdA-like domain-containing protein n=1 Tax=Stemphylium lycopersici TaxID=183478 RepID=A0A364ND18_STELY|nr:hypothetical protein DDE83_001578 [Stemphylium lycopersici]